MNNFFKYFENGKFVRWVYNPGEELNRYWEAYILNNPAEKKHIQDARLILQHLKSRKEIITREEAASLHSRIVIGLHNNKLPFTRRFFPPIFEYAAIALILISFGAIMFYQYNKKAHLTKYQPVEVTNFEEDARLILCDGKQVKLSAKESNIIYEQSGQIVINRTDTLEKATKRIDNEMNQLIIPYGKRSSVKLPDGTIVYLNAGSTLMYPTTFTGKTRELFLLGEAFFHVAHNPDLPFVVHTNDLTVTAFGTSFNVSAYPTDKIIETVLVEGKVVVVENSFKILKKSIVLSPNDLAAFNRESLETVISQVDIENYIAWRMGYLNFMSEQLSRIIARLERYYNIKIFLDNPLMGERYITGKLVLKEDKEKALEVLASTSKAELFVINNTTYGLK